MNMDFNEQINLITNRQRALNDLLHPVGRFPRIDIIKNGKVVETILDLLNGITNVGKNYLLDAAFNAGTQFSAWAIGLIDQASYSALASADTMSSHGGWLEFTTYTQSTRVAWGQGAAASQAVTNASPATFDISGSGTLKGIFIASNGTKGGTSGTLWSTALFTADVPVATSDQIKISYSLGC